MSKSHALKKSKKRSRKNSRSAGQTMVEFALTLPIVLILVFGIVEFARLFQSWITLQNSARAAVRYGVTGAWDVDAVAKHTDLPATDNILDEWVPCTEEDQTRFVEHWGVQCDPTNTELDGLRDDMARLPSIVERARANASGLTLNEGDNIVGLNRPDGSPMNTEPPGAEDEPGWFHVFMCSGRSTLDPARIDDDPNLPRYTLNNQRREERFCYLEDGTRPPAGSNQYDAGGPGDVLEVIVFYNAPLITPIKSFLGWTGLEDLDYVRMTARRVGVNEAFRTTRSVNEPPQLRIATPDGEYIVVSPDPTSDDGGDDDGTPPPTEPPTEEPTPEPTAEPTEESECEELLITNVYLNGSSLYIDVRNNSPDTEHNLSGAYFDWPDISPNTMYPSFLRMYWQGNDNSFPRRPGYVWHNRSDRDREPPTNVGDQGDDGRFEGDNRHILMPQSTSRLQLQFRNGPSDFEDAGYSIADFGETVLYFVNGTCPVPLDIPDTDPEPTPEPTEEPTVACEQLSFDFFAFQNAGVVLFQIRNNDTVAGEINGFNLNWKDDPKYTPATRVDEVRIGTSSDPGNDTVNISVWDGRDNSPPTVGRERGGGEPSWQTNVMLNGGQTMFMVVNFDGVGGPLTNFDAGRWDFNGSTLQVDDCIVEYPTYSEPPRLPVGDEETGPVDVPEGERAEPDRPGGQADTSARSNDAINTSGQSAETSEAEVAATPTLTITPTRAASEVPTEAASPTPSPTVTPTFSLGDEGFGE